MLDNSTSASAKSRFPLDPWFAPAPTARRRPPVRGSARLRRFTERGTAATLAGTWRRMGGGEGGDDTAGVPSPPCGDIMAALHHTASPAVPSAVHREWPPTDGL